MLHLESEKRIAFHRLEGALLEFDWELVKSLFHEFGVTFFSNEKEFYFNKINNSIFHYIVGYKKTGLVKMMLENGWDVNEKDKERDTALYYAVHYGGKKMLELLIKNGLDINYQNDEGETGLMMAWYEDKIKEFEVLYQNGADVNACDSDGDSIFDNINFNSEFGRKWMKMLLQEPERLNEKNLKIVKAERLKMLYN